MSFIHINNKSMKNSIQMAFVILATLLSSTVFSQKNYDDYRTVPNDPLNARIYTLDNGLKVYMSVNKDTPRIQTYIAVRVGGKNDPAETTGLAHYFEHLMFKGTKKFGTQNYAQEELLLNEIERLFELYRSTDDVVQRKAIYQQIDSVSYAASQFAIPNEYDKLMSAIGATGTNAYTGFDMTVYVENIPSNQIENWAKIQSDRFENNVIRGFHTELETVYEEKNMSLTRDGRKVYEKTLASLFPHHPYGKQTVLGTQEHLKNPSITNIKNYYKTYYVPNNMAICVAGDFNPDEMIRAIDTYFGALKPNPNLPALPTTKEVPLTKPVEVEVLGLEAQNVLLGWRFGGTSSSDKDMLDIIVPILYNRQAGLIDLNLMQQQKILSAYATTYSMSDHCAFVMAATPKEGQTLEEARDLLLGEIDKLKKGDFTEELLLAAINNLKASQVYRNDNISSRANWFVNSFINGTDWADEVVRLDRLAKITKKEIIDFANQRFKDNYAVIYKREGKDPSELKIDKPEITPIATNRDASSDFLREIQASKVTPIEPVFIDFEKDMSRLKAKSNIDLLYKQNVTNSLFSLIYVFDMGTNTDKAIGTAFEYQKYLGTSTKSPEQIKTDFYNIACTFNVYSGSERVYVVFEGLTENMEKGLALLEETLADMQVNDAAYANLTADILKKRADAKLNQGANFSKLGHYATWGADSPDKNILSETELKSLNPQELVDRIKNLNSYQHCVLYYGPESEEKILATINKWHRVPAQLKPVPQDNKFKRLETKENKVYLAEYDAKQIYLGMVSNDGRQYDTKIEPLRRMYNEYFGGSMNAIVFQEMREARGLAYSAGATLYAPTKLNDPYMMQTFIATQNDKMEDALAAFESIINDMPESENAFKLAQEAIITKLRTSRTIKERVLWEYINAQDLGLKTDLNKELFEKIPTMTLADIKAFQEDWVKNRKYTYYILGKEADLDLKALEKYGKIERISQEALFGY